MSDSTTERADLIQALRQHIPMLNSAAMPARSEVFVLCGRPAGDLRDALAAAINALSTLPAAGGIEDQGFSRDPQTDQCGSQPGAAVGATAALARVDAFMKRVALDSPERERVECAACGGSGQIDHPATLTGANVHSACTSTCDDCAGIGRVEVPLNPEHEAKAAAFRAEDHIEADITEAELTVRMLETWFPEMFPANELGQVHMARCMAESAADMIRALIADRTPTPPASTPPDTDAEGV